MFGLSAISGIGEKLAEDIITERNNNGKYKSIEDLSSRVKLTKSQVIALIKSGTIPCKNKKNTLVKYLLSLYEPTEFREVKALPTYSKLENEFNIDISKFKLNDSGRKKYDKEALLVEYNKVKKENHAKSEELRLEKYKEENNKYLEQENFWEFETLQVFISYNPFNTAYEYIDVEFEEVINGDKCVIPGIISRVQKKKDKSGKQFAYANIYSAFGLVEGIIWHSKYKEYEDLIKKGSQVTLLCKKDSEDKVVIEKMKDYNEWLEQKIKERNQ